MTSENEIFDFLKDARSHVDQACTYAAEVVRRLEQEPNCVTARSALQWYTEELQRQSNNLESLRSDLLILARKI
jgi:hypothetical protein